jgi:hypothetical protein
MLPRKRRWYCEEPQLPEDWLPLRKVLLASSTLVALCCYSGKQNRRSECSGCAPGKQDLPRRQRSAYQVHTGNAVAFAGQLVDKLLKLWKLYLELLYCGSKLISNTLGISTALELDW